MMRPFRGNLAPFFFSEKIRGPKVTFSTPQTSPSKFSTHQKKRKQKKSQMRGLSIFFSLLVVAYVAGREDMELGLLEESSDFSSDLLLDAEEHETGGPPLVKKGTPTATASVGRPTNITPQHPFVVSAVNHVLKQINFDRKKCEKKEFATAACTSITAAPDSDQTTLQLEIKADGASESRLYNVAVRRVPLYKREYNAETRELKNWETLTIHPLPCSDATLVSTYFEINQHNANPDRSYSKKMYHNMLFNRVSYPPMGAVKPDFDSLPKENVAFAADLEWLWWGKKSKGASDSNGAASSIPANYDFRTQYPDCRATSEIFDQGSDCGSCYAQAGATSYAASLCKITNGVANIKLSPRELADCTNGCGGGWATTIFDYMTLNGVTEEYCHVETGVAGQCSTAPSRSCTNGALWKVQNYTAVYFQSETFAQRELAIQKLLLQYGPLWIPFQVMPGFHEYFSGVFATNSSNDPKQSMGLHAVTLVGWETDPSDSTKNSWILQNSWSDQWGEKGRFRIRRGVNECGIEDGPIAYVIPQKEASNIPSKYQRGKTCLNNGSLQSDGSCHCWNRFSGTRCETCAALTCKNSGIFDSKACKCVCPPGITSEDCSDTPANLNANEVCRDGTGSDLMIRWTVPSNVGSYCNVQDNVPHNAKDREITTYFCGNSSEWSQVRPKCETSGAALMNMQKVRALPVGDYKIVCVENLGMNEFGMPRGIGWIGDGQSFGTFSVKESGCGGSSSSSSTTTRMLQETMLPNEEDAKFEDEDDAIFSAMFEDSLFDNSNDDDDDDAASDIVF